MKEIENRSNSSQFFAVTHHARPTLLGRELMRKLRRELRSELERKL